MTARFGDSDITEPGSRVFLRKEYTATHAAVMSDDVPKLFELHHGGNHQSNLSLSSNAVCWTWKVMRRTIISKV